MEKALLSIPALGWIDIFNPVAVSTVLVLLPMARRRWHVLIYVYGAYAAYASACVALYFGVDLVLLELWKRLTAQQPVATGVGLTAIGAAALAGCALAVVRLVSAMRRRREISFEKVLFVKSAAPWFILLLSFGSTWSCMFSAYAAIAYIGILVANGIETVPAVWMIAVFSLFSVIPSLSVYLLATRVKGERLGRIIGGIRRVMSGFCLYSIPVVLAAVSAWCLAAGIGALIV